MKTELHDVVIIGAGPSGSCIGSLLSQHNADCIIIERQTFPRFSIGESLLPQCMAILEEANMLTAVEKAGFQFKNGAAFQSEDSYCSFDFSEKLTEGPESTFQVQRATFDKILADSAQAQGVPIRYQHEVLSIEELETGNRLHIRNLTTADEYYIECKFLLDASGFGRVLPRLLDLEAPSDFPIRHSYFAHIKDNIECPDYDRNKILVGIHPEHKDIWYWLIPFQEGISSVGVVGEPKYFEHKQDFSEEDILLDFIQQNPRFQTLLKNAELHSPARCLKGYSASVTQLYGNRYALLGNAGEFLDPVFSSGVTIALKSAQLAAPLVIRSLKGEQVDWEAEYSIPLNLGINTFRTFVTAWYDQRFQTVIFSKNQDDKIRQMICSILAGYAWDTNNPFVGKSEARLNTLVKLCQL